MTTHNMLVKNCVFVTCLLIVFATGSHWAFDDIEEHDYHRESSKQDKTPLPKDKVLLRDVKTLAFQRNKRTTSKRTHPIHQLSCVGGTAGCKLFTPDVVECKNIGFDDAKSKFDWRCHADISDRVVFNHVEVICEGYDYPEDDYILLGSCGLEFTLDFADPHDHHHKSYFHYMDDHEKKLHHDRVHATTKPVQSASLQFVDSISNIFERSTAILSNHLFLVASFLVGVLCTYLIMRYFANSDNEASKNSSMKQQSPRRGGSSYGPLTSAVLTTKKAC